ncbi:MAG: hypothetical protein ACMXYG_02590 [Candidatus Woesearchaeota archaeon]
MTEYKKIRIELLNQTKLKLRNSVEWDLLAIQTISSIEELEKIINQSVVRIREWYSWYNPEISKKIKNNEKFVELITIKTKKELLDEINLKESIGKDLEKKDIDTIINFAENVLALIKTKEEQINYLDEILKNNCPNTHNILGTTLSAKILRQIGGIQKLAKTPAPVIQIIGAEKTLFKHMTGKAKSPKYGILHEHYLINKVNKKNKGKMARAIADKVAIAARLDFFKGKFMNYKTELEIKSELLK